MQESDTYQQVLKCGSLQVRMRKAPLSILRVTVDRYPETLGVGMACGIGGVVVLGQSAPKECSLRLVASHGGSPVNWGLPSPAMEKKHPQSPNKSAARYRIPGVVFTTEDELLTLQLVDEDRGTVIDLADIGILAVSPEVACELFNTARGNVLGAAGHMQEAEYLKLRTQMDSVAAVLPVERRREWREASIYLDAMARKNPKETFQEFRAFRQESEEAGYGSEFKKFSEQLYSAIYPYTLTAHGYHRALGSMDEDAVLTGLADKVSRLSQIGYEYFINSGTLLGYVREGRLIPHDDDIDLAVLLKGQTLTELVEEWIELREKLDSVGILNREFMDIHYKLGRAGEAGVDLFPAWVHEGKLYVWPYTFADENAEALLPLRPARWGSVVLNAPNDPEALLRANYGEGWRVPDPAFKFDWGRAHKRFVDFVRLLKEKRQEGVSA